jgi:hypothetical protein
MNSIRPYWGWDRADVANHTEDALLSFDPEWIVLAIKRPSDDGKVPGYDRVADFPGALLFKGGKLEPDHYIVLRRRSE